MSGRSPERVTEVDLLRFLAALAVVFFHYAFRGSAADGLTTMSYPELQPMARYGYLGVELFFMISGFVVMMTAAKGSLKGFVVSRVVRLYPAFWVCCTVTFILLLVMGSGRFHPTLAQFLVNMTMLNELFGVEPIDGVYWSLFVEIKFYLMVAVVLALRRIHQAERFVLAWLAVTAAMELLPIGKVQWLMMTDYAPYFIGGALCYFVYAGGVRWWRVAALALTCGLAIRHSLVSMTRVNAHYAAELNTWAVALVVMGFFLAMWLIAVRRTAFFGRRDWLMLGALTYPLYLIHQYIGFELFNRLGATVERHLLFWGVIALMLALAYAVHRYVEQRWAPHLKRAVSRLLAIERQAAVPASQSLTTR